MTAAHLKELLDVMQAANVMQGRIKDGEFELAVVFAPVYTETTGKDASPGGWKTEPSDPSDPDPLQLGPLDAPIAFDDTEVQP